MPVVTIRFNLPEEQTEFDTAINAANTKLAIWDFQNQLRSWYKYHHDFSSADDALEKIREEFFRCFNAHNVMLD